MRLDHKTLRIETKAGLVDFEARTFTGYAAVYNNRDEGGDVIMPGAFDKTMPRILAGKVKLIDGHDYWDGTEKVVGKAISAVSDEVGLLVTFLVAKGEDGDVLLNKIADGIIDALSIGYKTILEEEATDPDTGVQTTYLKEIKLYEVSVVIWGMNPLALIDPASVKSLPDDLAEIVIPLTKGTPNAELLRSCAAKLTALADSKSTPPPAPGDADEAPAEQDDHTAADADEAKARKAEERTAIANAALVQLASH